MTRTKAAFQTAFCKKTAIRSGDTVRYDIQGIYIWRPGDTALEKLEDGRKYLITNPGNMDINQMKHVALELAALIGLLAGLPMITIVCGEEGISYQIETAA